MLDSPNAVTVLRPMLSSNFGGITVVVMVIIAAISEKKLIFFSLI